MSQILQYLLKIILIFTKLINAVDNFNVGKTVHVVTEDVSRNNIAPRGKGDSRLVF